MGIIHARNAALLPLWAGVDIARSVQFEESQRSPIRTLMCREAAEMKQREAWPIIFEACVNHATNGGRNLPQVDSFVLN